MAKETRGRPKSITPEIISKLEEAFLVGASDKEACFMANIGMSTLYDYCKAHPEFSERKEALKDMVKYQARANIAKSINEGDKLLSQWYLERKAKEEFSQRSELTGSEGKDLIPAEAKEKSKIAISTYLNDNTGNSKQ